VLGGVKDIREAVERAEARADAQMRAGADIVFVDEVHRFNKAQQDAFLPHVESGLFTFIGATTENPSFEVNSALLSRATVHVLQPLGRRPARAARARAAARCRRRRFARCRRATRWSAYADGDARRLLNTARATSQHRGRRDAAASTRPRARRRRWASSCAATTRAASSSTTDLGAAQVRARLGPGRGAVLARAHARRRRRSALLARRMIRMASEDIGLADPRALRMALDAAETYERLGSPEGELALAEAVLYLAVAPKSNAVYAAYGAVRAFVRRTARAGAAAPAQRADEADEGARLRQGLPLRARRGGGLRGGRALLPARRRCRPRVSSSKIGEKPQAAVGWMRRLSNAWPGRGPSAKPRRGLSTTARIAKASCGCAPRAGRPPRAVRCTRS
jgi:hypothetical protein